MTIPIQKILSDRLLGKADAYLFETLREPFWIVTKPKHISKFKGSQRDVGSEKLRVKQLVGSRWKSEIDLDSSNSCVANTDLRVMLPNDPNTNFLAAEI